MRPIQAITICLRKAFQFSGRASRAEFWGFAPIGAGLPLIATFFLPPEIGSFGTLFATVLLFVILATPFSAAASRRFHDSGEPHREFWLGFVPALGLISSSFILMSPLLGISISSSAQSGTVVVVLGGVLFLVCLLYAPISIGATIGRLLSPASPGPNRYGPNPLEVTP